MDFDFLFRRTMQQSLRGLACTDDCHGRMVQLYSDAALHTQLKYLEALFDTPRVEAKKNRNQLVQLELIAFKLITFLCTYYTLDHFKS